MAERPPRHACPPRVARRPRRRLGPPPVLDPAAPVVLPPALEALLAHRHAARLARAERRSLHPDHLARIARQSAVERAVEENLARGRVLIRHEIRRATDPARAGLDRVRFPPLSCTLCEIVRPLVWGLGILMTPAALCLGLVLLVGI